MYVIYAGLCIYYLFVWPNLNFLHISQWITLPTQSCLVLYSFCANSLHSLIMWLMASSLSPHSLHLVFCWVLSILALIWLVLMALFCAVIRRDFVSLLKFSFLCFSYASSSCCQVHFPGFHGPFDEVSCDILYILRQFIIQLCGSISYAFL